MDNTLFLHQ